MCQVRTNPKYPILLIHWMIHKAGDDAEILLHGTSMGGATVLMATGLELPAQVKGIISDCGFTSAKEVFTHVLHSMYHLPAFPMIQIASMVNRKKAGYGLDDCNSAREVRKATVPALLIHGSGDTFVPCSMCDRIYESYACENKKKLIVEGAAHAESYYKDPAAYEGEVFDRIGKFVDYASANDTLLLHENEKDIYGAMAPECKKLMDTFYGDHFKAIFDFANFVQCGQDTLEAYEMLKSYIAYIHVKDALKSDQSVVPAGYGDGNVAVILKRLSASGFDGFLSLEPHLFEFEGFHALEKDGRSIAVKEKRVLSGLETFTIAHDALMKLLDNCM